VGWLIVAFIAFFVFVIWIMLWFAAATFRVLLGLLRFMLRL
jgi:hypothetical protein